MALTHSNDIPAEVRLFFKYFFRFHFDFKIPSEFIDYDSFDFYEDFIEGYYMVLEGVTFNSIDISLNNKFLKFFFKGTVKCYALCSVYTHFTTSKFQ